MALLSREQILAAPDRRYVEVDVPEWGGAVRVASMTAAQVVEYTDVEQPKRMFWLLAATIVDQTGAPVFTLDDVPELEKKSPAATLRVYREAAKLNVLSPEAAEEVRGN